MSNKLIGKCTDFLNSLAFKFYWDQKSFPEAYQISPRIDDICFNGMNFGKEGKINQTFDWQRKNIEYNELLKKVINSAMCVHPSISKEILEYSKGRLIEDILGLKKSYNISDCLIYLRNLPENSKTHWHNLLQRVFSLISYDILDKQSVELTDLDDLYKDLNLQDKKISPVGRQSQTANFVSFCLYQDDKRRIRIHFIRPNKETEFPRDHYGSSASIILAGGLVNQHLAVYEAENEKNADFGLYLIKPHDKRNNEDRDFCFRTNVNLNVISSHFYKKGDHYFLPGPRKIQNDLNENDLLTFHRIDTKDYAITLFCQEFDAFVSHTTFPVGEEKEKKREHLSNILSFKDSAKIIEIIHSFITKKSD
ncbi:unnamed protein product [Brachionus calyciflorus]|uniref:Uncharacterized protein n=1 Tax=Brachionus calyciflorus TaxID=104777 RepID=A0A814A3K7_9BILA|nr:unnamed protein product [Brachionus calyciflorus]